MKKRNFTKHMLLAIMLFFLCSLPVTVHAATVSISKGDTLEKMIKEGLPSGSLTIKLTKNISVGYLNQIHTDTNLVIDGNGHSITGRDDRSDIHYFDGSLKLKNVKLVRIGIFSNGKLPLTISGCEFKNCSIGASGKTAIASSKFTDSMINNSGGTLTVSKSTFTLKKITKAILNGSSDKTKTSKLVVKSGTFKVSSPEPSTAYYLIETRENSSTTIESGTFTNGTLSVNGGNLTIKNGTIKNNRSYCLSISSGKVVLQKGKIVSSYQRGDTIAMWGGKLTINGGTVEAAAPGRYAISLYGTNAKAVANKGAKLLWPNQSKTDGGVFMYKKSGTSFTNKTGRYVRVVVIKV